MFFKIVYLSWIGNPNFNLFGIRYSEGRSSGYGIYTKDKNAKTKSQ